MHAVFKYTCRLWASPKGKFVCPGPELPDPLAKNDLVGVKGSSWHTLPPPIGMTGVFYWLSGKPFI